MKNTDLFIKPAAVMRLGDDIFLKLPLYRAQKSYRPIYINDSLFQKYFGEHFLSSWKEKADFISQYFSFILTPTTPEAEQIGWAYVDKQADPSNISMGGNRGSGRAYYVGKHFNIKGEKTPLATSSIQRLSDGYLEAERGVWETVAANALKHDLESDVSPVLAILDMQETCSVVWRHESVKRVKIVRIDDDGTLDRVSHIFYNKHPLTKEDLFHTGEKFARLESEKFIHRILHGAWSPGNISLNGALIDLDTVCAVKGRSPSFSATPWHQENYFGHEYKGQAKILEMLAEDTVINRDHVDAPTLIAFMQQRKDELAIEKFISLMGFKNTALIMKSLPHEVTALYKVFHNLGGFFYPQLHGMSLKDTDSDFIHVVDFSTFFRFYPLLRRTGTFSTTTALNLMVNTNFLNDVFVKTPLPIIENEKIDEYFENVLKNFIPNLVLSTAALRKVKDDVSAFTQAFDDLFTKIDKLCDEDLLEVEARAYLINEDRYYFFAAHTPSYAIAQKIGEIEDEDVHRLIDIYTSAISRRPQKNEQSQYRCDIRLYNEGYFHRLLDGKGGYYACFCLFKRDAIDNYALDEADKRLEFMVNGEKISHEVIHTAHEINIISSRQDSKMLALRMGRTLSPLSDNVTLAFNGTVISLSDIIEF